MHVWMQIKPLVNGTGITALATLRSYTSTSPSIFPGFSMSLSSTILMLGLDKYTAAVLTSDEGTYVPIMGMIVYSCICGLLEGDPEDMIHFDFP